MPLTHRGPFLLVFALSQLTGRLLGRHLAGSGLTASEFAVYSLLLVEGRITPSRMAQVLGMPPTTLSYVLRQMHDRGHLRRLHNPKDGRSTLLELTAEGQRITQRATRGFARAIDLFREHLELPEGKLLTALEAMSAALEESIGAEDALSCAG